MPHRQYHHRRRHCQYHRRRHHHCHRHNHQRLRRHHHPEDCVQFIVESGRGDRGRPHHHKVGTFQFFCASFFNPTLAVACSTLPTTLGFQLILTTILGFLTYPDHHFGILTYLDLHIGISTNPDHHFGISSYPDHHHQTQRREVLLGDWRSSTPACYLLAPQTSP